MSMRVGRDLTLRQVAPNAVTAMALCFGLTAIRFAILGSNPEQAQLLAPTRPSFKF